MAKSSFPKGPWDDGFELRQNLAGRTGQGETFLATRRTDNAEVVVKILNNQKSEQARLRMSSEVHNLKILYDARAKVPLILNDNMEFHSDVKTKLYFAMERIAGDTLGARIGMEKGCDPRMAIDIALDLLRTLAIAQDLSIYHRDVKPDNIMVRSEQPIDVLFVDYGLSFNKKYSETISQTNESIDNNFLSLPERRELGGNRRDPRSDITGVIGILYYCLTGKYPRDLVGSDGKPPHRRSGASISEAMGDLPIVAHLLPLFDIGFRANIEQRFQTTLEAASRLENIKDGVDELPDSNPSELAKVLYAELLEVDRPSQLNKLSSLAGPFQNFVVNKLNAQANQLEGFVMKVHSSRLPNISASEGTEALTSQPVTFFLSPRPHAMCRGWIYEIRAIKKKMELAIVRLRVAGTDFNPNQLRESGKWETIHKCFMWDASVEQLLAKDIGRTIEEAMRLVVEEVRALPK